MRKELRDELRLLSIMQATDVRYRRRPPGPSIGAILMMLWMYAFWAGLLLLVAP